jgi:nicotinamide-nucleotide amidase
MNYELAIENIRSELREYIIKGNLQSLVLGVSGGIDSTLCALLAKPVCDELNIPLIGRSLPTRTNSSGENLRAKKIGLMFCSDFKETAIQSAFNKMADVSEANYNVIIEATDHKYNILAGNIKARIRMILLYDLAGTNDGLVLSTDNWTEYLLGFWTLHGDVGDYGMIQSLWKTEVYEMTLWIMAHELATLPEMEAVEEVIEANATDGLGISNSDLDQIIPGWEGNSRDGYAEVDERLKNITDGGVTNLSDPVYSRYIRTMFKRENPFNIPRNKI